MRSFFVFLILISLGSTSYLVSKRLEAMKPEWGGSWASYGYLPSGRLLGSLLAGHETVMADYLWIRAINLFGERYREDMEDTEWYKWLFHLLDIATELDPLFRDVYKYGGLILRLDSIMVDQSNFIFKKGMDHIPDYWFFPFAIGMNYYEFRDDLKRASEYIKRAASLKGAPFYLQNLAATFMKESGQTEAALHFLKEEIRVVRDPLRKKAMEVKIRILEHDTGALKLEEGLEVFSKRYDRMPAGLDELVEKGVISEIPRDPFGGEYTITSGGKVQSSRYEEELERIRREYRLGTNRGDPSGTPPGM